MPKSTWKAKRKTARTKKKEAKRRAAKGGKHPTPRNERVRAEHQGQPLALLFARDVFATLTSTGLRPIKFKAGEYRQTQRNRKAA